MGIGLSISRTIIAEHGGKIWAEPNPGGGTIFRFSLPATMESARDVE
jgi:two-component system sensor kinase FixL